MADRVLLKSGPLTDEEWALMKQHPTISAEIIEALLDDDFVAGVRHHHEHWDGGGYPDGLAGEEIPLIARLLCLVDSYDAGTWIGAAAPIRDDEGGIGGLVVASCTPGEGLPAGVLGSAVSDTFSQIRHTAGARQTRAEIESMTDALTGLYNHRRFHELLRDAVEGAQAAEGDVAVLFCDIDRFKQLNDRHGHLVGDDVLRRASHIMTASVRRGDVAARYGGDEFGVLLHGAGIETAMEVAERIRERVAELWVGRGDAATTISIGVATLAGHLDAEELLASADRAMYAAKVSGRERVVRADTLEAAPARLTSQL